MKKTCVLVLAFLLTAVYSLPGQTGTLTANQFLYKPSLGALGTAEKNTFDAGLDRVDVRLGKSIWVGDPAIAAGLGLPAVEYITPLESALAAIGSTPATLHAPRGNYTVSDNTVIPANVLLKPERGAIFNITDGKTLTIGSFAGDPSCQYFAWSGTGKVVFAHGAVNEVYLPWWGGFPGTANDCTAALNAAVAATTVKGFNAYGPPIRLTDGIWRFTSPLVWSDNPVQIYGPGKTNCALLADINNPSADAISITTVGNNPPVILKGFQIIGPANSCQNALVLTDCMDADIDLNIRTGATQYAYVLRGCIYGHFKLGAYYLGGIGYSGTYAGAPANGLNIKHSTGNATNVAHIWIHFSGFTGNAVTIGNSTDANNVIDLSGSIEYTSGYSIYAENPLNPYGTNLNIHDLYAEDGTTLGMYFKNYMWVTLNNIYSYGKPLYFKNCDGVAIGTCWFGTTTIDANCRRFSVNGAVAINGTGGWNDKAPDTVYAGTVHQHNTGTTATRPGYNFRAGAGDAGNLIANADFRRWQSDRPDGWTKGSSQVWTQCGDGLSDTTRRATPYCAKTTVTGSGTGYFSTTYTLSSDTVKKIAGQPFTFSAWICHAAGQQPSVYPYLRIRFYDGSTNWDWGSFAATPLSASTDGTWTKVLISCTAPATAVSGQIDLFQYVLASGGSDTLYLSELCLWSRIGAANTFVPGRDEHGDYLIVNGQKISFGTAPPSSGWWNQGDVRFNSAATVGQPKGWQCIVSGTPGTWVSMGNL
jgi:hypothetical protein